jgi:hypothetical protein
MTDTQRFLSGATDEERILWQQTIDPKQVHAPLVYSDWLRERGRELEADYWQIVSQWRDSALQGEFNCSMWMLTCGEITTGWSDLKANGCPQCRKWATVNLKERMLRNGLVVSPFIPERVL